MPKLHELLAVDANLKAQATAAKADLGGTFKNKRHHFSETRKTFKPMGENELPRVEEQLDLQTTVKQELDWLTPFLVKSIDVSYQVAEGDMAARADVVLESGTVILSQVPATALLELEKRFNDLRLFVSEIPTLDPAKGFRADPDRGDGVFRARDVNKKRTAKIQEPLVLYPATDKHPAQTQMITKDVVVGDILEQEWSGLITVSEKGYMIERVEELARAIKKARSRANDIELDTKSLKIGDKLVGYVFNGK